MSSNSQLLKNLNVRKATRVVAFCFNSEAPKLKLPHITLCPHIPGHSILTL